MNTHTKTVYSISLSMERASEIKATIVIFISERENIGWEIVLKYFFQFITYSFCKTVYSIPYRNVKGVWWMPRLQKAMKDVVWLR